MKKTLVALAVAAVAASANATTVYNQNGTKVDVGGRIDVMLGKFGDAQRTDLRNNSSRVEFKAEHEVQNGLKAIGAVRFGLGDAEKEDTSFNDIKLSKLWLGLKHNDIGKVTFGKQNTTADDVQLNDHTYIFGGNNNLVTSGDKVVSFRTADIQLAEGQTLGFGADYGFGEAHKKDIQGKDSDKKHVKLKNTYGLSAFYTGNFGDVKVNANAGYTVRNENTKVGVIASKTDNQQQAWRLATQVEFGPASFGIEYGQTVYQSKVQHEFQGSARFVEVGAKYAVLPDVLNVYTQWQRNSLRSASGTSAKKFEQPFALSYVKLADLELEEHQKAVQNVFIVGADYAFNKNLLAYAEFANSRVKAPTKDKNVRESFYAAGLRVYF
ncbi:porin [Histophilus somni]|uniref:Majour outer membrane protein n=1 Tax=Histophilus somni TaxID=731 RepID=A0A2Z5WR35_HISSO|nr:majour outer membrane protein [Histophilus somni]BBC81977.1 major outer membrane protein [Histophilus somni]BBC82001.1 major outer membrane protein [Histophilus somni]BBC82005.1 major outer membrane protein [Histophilus somni]BBC82011.1 major outer membrane protein [Histophilus somni]